MTDVQELRDVLTAQAERAPDGAGLLADVHAGAVRLRRRRRIAAGGALAAAVAVAVAAPLVLDGIGGTGARPQPGTSVRSDDTPAGLTVGVRLRANPTYRVTDARVDTGSAALTIWPGYADDVDTTSGDQMVDPRYRSAQLEILAPSRFDPSRMKAEGEPVTVNGKPAFYIPKLAEGQYPPSTTPPAQGQESTPFEDAVGWAGRDGTWILLRGGGRFPKDELLQLAGLVEEVPGYTVDAPVTLPYLPAGVAPYFTSTQGGDERGYGNQRMSAAFAPPGDPMPADPPTEPVDLVQVLAFEQPTEVLANAGKWGEPERVGGKEIWHPSVADAPTVMGSPVVSGVDPQRAEVVVVRTAGCVVTFGVGDKGKLPPGTLTRMAREARVYDCAKPATWQPLR
jgi:hypothetical protein